MLVMHGVMRRGVFFQMPDVGLKEFAKLHNISMGGGKSGF
jgi:hypothetical protein